MKRQRSLISLVGTITLLTGTLGSPGTASAISFNPAPEDNNPPQPISGVSRSSFIPPPESAAPRQATGGASRSTFAPPPESAAPRQATGGASRSTFAPPPESAAPRQATGGASRTNFTPPPSSTAPRQTIGGASRSTFTPPPSSTAPRQTIGGASRSTFTPPPSSAAPRQAIGGASRTNFTPPPSSAAPRQAIGGASRTNLYGSYVASNQPVSMLAVLPNSFYGTTLAGHPTILVYLPASTAREVVFSLKDEAKNLHYHTTLPISGESGIVTIKMPENAPPLEVGKNYQWYVALKLDGALSPKTPFVDGWIKRIAPQANLEKALAGKSALQQADILAAKGVWYDCSAILAALILANPTDETVIKEWQELLTSVQLPQLTTSPLWSVALNGAN